MNRVVCTLGVLVFVAFGAARAENAAPDAANAGNAANGGNGRRQFDPEQFKQRMLDRVKESLELTDEQMKAIQPLVEAVQKAQSDSRGGMGFGGFGMRRRNNAGGDAAGGNAATTPPKPEPRNDVERKAQELQALLQNKDSDAGAVKQKLQELRDAREKAKQDLKKTQDALREVLTPRQEAQAALLGLLD